MLAQMVQYKGQPVVWESPHFVAIVDVLPKEDLQQYVVYNKEHGVPEAWHPTLLFVKEWCKAMEKALDDFDEPAQAKFEIMNNPFKTN